jgi:hypothetical protein
MTLKEIVDGLMRKDSYEILLWLSFLSTKISCVDCIEVCKSKNKIPICSNCVPAKNLIKKLNLEKGVKDGSST